MSLRGCSSDVAKRGFCAGCGSTISYDGDDDSEVIWLTAGTHNDAGCLPQREHVYVEDKLVWVASQKPTRSGHAPRRVHRAALAITVEAQRPGEKTTGKVSHTRHAALELTRKD